MKKYQFREKTEELNEEERMEEEENNKSKELIDILKTENFGNENQRKKFIDIITSLFNLKDQEARQFFKKLGQACTEIGSEINKEEVDENTESKIKTLEEQIAKENNNNSFIPQSIEKYKYIRN